MGSHQPLMLVLPLFIMLLKASLMAFCILICGIILQSKINYFAV